MWPLRIRKLVRAVAPVPEPQPSEPPGPGRSVSLNRAFTYRPSRRAETNLAPHGSPAFTASTCFRLRISISGPVPKKKTLGMRKYRAAAATCPGRSASDQPTMTRTAPDGTPGEAVAVVARESAGRAFVPEPHPPKRTISAATTASNFADASMSRSSHAAQVAVRRSTGLANECPPGTLAVRADRIS